MVSGRQPAAMPDLEANDELRRADAGRGEASPTPLEAGLAARGEAGRHQRLDAAAAGLADDRAGAGRTAGGDILGQRGAVTR